jgi:hypothetical protein
MLNKLAKGVVRGSKGEQEQRVCRRLRLIMGMLELVSCWA